MKTIDTLVDDIYEVFDKGVTVDPSLTEEFGKELSAIVADRVSERKRKTMLRMSNLGKPCKRQLWYSVNTPELGEKLPGYAYVKFLIGDITEAVIMFLAKIAGHTVTDQQKEVNIDGVKGHIDGIIDDVLVDVKSASPYSYRKFEDGLNPETDAFGYLGQLGGYAHGLARRVGAFIAVDKVLGHITVDKHELPEKDYVKEVAEVREMLAHNQPPPRAYEDEADGRSGNRKLSVPCSYCEFRSVCWPGLQTYQYNRGPVFLTKVVRTPKVEKL